MPYVIERTRRHAHQLPHNPQGCPQDELHRQDDKRRHLRQPLQARASARSAASVPSLRRTSALSPTSTVFPPLQFAVVDVPQRAHRSGRSKTASVSPVIAMVDTNSDPNTVDYVIPLTTTLPRSIESRCRRSRSCYGRRSGRT